MAINPVLGEWELLHFVLVLINILNKTESAVFVYCTFSLLLEDPFFQIIYNIQGKDWKYIYLLNENNNILHSTVGSY